MNGGSIVIARSSCARGDEAIRAIGTMELLAMTRRYGAPAV